MINIKTASGFENVGNFCIGDNRVEAQAIFNKLKGTPEVNEKCILQLDFVETKEGLPFNLKIISCTLEGLAENCKTITKEVFRVLTLEKQ